MDPAGGWSGPVTEHASAADVSPGAASGGRVAKVGWCMASAWRSRKSVRSLALASRKVRAGRFHFRSIMARIDVWS